MNFKEFINRNTPGFSYESWLDPKDLAMYKSLSKRIDQAYETHDYKTAERLEAKLEELLERLEAFISEKEQEGGEEENLDVEYGLQDEMAMFYAQFINGDINQNELTYRLRASLVDVPNLSISNPIYRSSQDTEKIDGEKLINMAKDAYLNKKALLDKKRNLK